MRSLCCCSASARRSAQSSSVASPRPSPIRATRSICSSRPSVLMKETSIELPRVREQHYWITSSTRRFCGSRTQSPVCTNSLPPRPITVIVSAGNPPRTRFLGGIARRRDRAKFVPSGDCATPDCHRHVRSAGQMREYGNCTRRQLGRDKRRFSRESATDRATRVHPAERCARGAVG